MCNFIMIMILLVTAYNGIAKKGRREGKIQWLHTGLQQILQTSSRAHCLQPASLPVLSAIP